MTEAGWEYGTCLKPVIASATVAAWRGQWAGLRLRPGYHMADETRMGYPAVPLRIRRTNSTWLVDMRKGVNAAHRRFPVRRHAPPAWADSLLLPELLEQRSTVSRAESPATARISSSSTKRAVHRQMDVMRAAQEGIRAGQGLCTLGTHQPSTKQFMGDTRGRRIDDGTAESG